MANDEPFKRVPIPEAVKARVWLRDGGRCAHCTARLTTETVDYEHRIPAWVLKDPARYNDPGNIDLICGLRSGERCHVDKTAKDSTDRAKIKRLIKKEAGEQAPSKRPMKSRGFAKGHRPLRSRSTFQPRNKR